MPQGPWKWVCMKETDSITTKAWVRAAVWIAGMCLAKSICKQISPESIKLLLFDRQYKSPGKNIGYLLYCQETFLVKVRLRNVFRISVFTYLGRMEKLLQLVLVCFITSTSGISQGSRSSKPAAALWKSHLVKGVSGVSLTQSWPRLWSLHACPH